MNSEIHFANDPDDPFCGRIATKTLCGGKCMAVTNWDVGNVTCERCLEVMEERAVGLAATAEPPTLPNPPWLTGGPWTWPGFRQEYSTRVKKK